MRFSILVVPLVLAVCGVAAATDRAPVASVPGHAEARRAPDSDSARPPSVSLAPGQLLIYFKRVVGADPTASQLVVDRDRAASALVTNGGPGGEHRQDFRLAAGQFGRLRDLIRTAALRDTSCCDPNFYVYFVSTGDHSWRLAQRRLPRHAQALIADLNAITDAHTNYKGPSG